MRVIKSITHLLKLLVVSLTIYKTSYVIGKSLAVSDEYPEGMFLTSTVITKQHEYYEDIHGLYRLTNTTYNSAPVYKKMRANITKAIFLFLDSDLHWEVSPDLGGNNQFLLSIRKYQLLPPESGWLSLGMPPWSDTGIRIDHLLSDYMARLENPFKIIQLLHPIHEDNQDNNILFGHFDLLAEPYNDHPQYRSHDYNSFIYLNDYGLWMIGTSQYRNSATPLSLSPSLVASPELWPEWEIVEHSVADLLSIRLVHTGILDEYVLREDGFYCLSTRGSLIHSKNSLMTCDSMRDCRKGKDEDNCPFYVNLGVTIIILTSLGIVSMGSVLFAVLSWYRVIGIKETFFLIPSEEIEEEVADDPSHIDELIDNIVKATNRADLEDISAFDEDFMKIHDSPKGLEVLLQTAHLLMKSPEKNKALYLLMMKEEERLHDCRNMKSINPVILECIRSTGGSNEATQSFIHFSDGSDMGKRKYDIWETVFPSKLINMSVSSWIYPGIQIIFEFINSMVLVKDVLLCMFFFSKYEDLPLFFQGLVSFNVFTIIAAQILKGCYIIAHQEKVLWFQEQLPKKKHFILQGVLLLLSPFVPTMLTLKYIILERNLKQIFLKKSSPTKLYKKYEERKEEMRGISHLIHTLRMIEANLQSFPQMVLLLTFLIISNSLVFETEGLNKTIVILNLLFTYFLSSFTFLNWTNTMSL